MLVFYLHGFWGENSGHHAFMTICSHVELLQLDFYVFGDTRSTLEFKESPCCLPLWLREGNSMTVIIKLERLCGYALIWNVNLIRYSLFSHNTRCLTKLWIEILNIWIYLRIWSRSLTLGMYAFRTRFTFIVLRSSSLLFEFYKIYDTIDSII